MMNVLLIGSGGREHALAWKMAQSKKLDQLFIAPGNAGTAAAGTNVNIKVNDFPALGKFCMENHIQMVVVGPEEPLVKGITNFFESEPALKDIPVIGPGKEGARLEGSKEFAKEFMARHHIPTARYKSFTKDTLSAAREFLKTLSPPYVLKADGLAAGKGVAILPDLARAEQELNEMFSGKFGEAGNKVVIEEFLSGIEVSVFALTDGESYIILPEAKDYKRVGEGDSGLNTGGMGSVSPVPFADKLFMQKVEDRIVRPTFEGLKKENISYRGFVFFGLINVNKEPFVIEYNVRLGDPETEVVMPRIASDVIEMFQAVAERKLKDFTLRTDPRTAAAVMLVSGGYPGAYVNGKEITNLDQVSGSLLFHAGTKQEGNTIVTNGGRVLAVTSYGDSIAEATEKSNSNAAIIQFEGRHFRHDIGFDL
jgi:phosphoribosylamine--glycine ligase